MNALAGVGSGRGRLFGCVGRAAVLTAVAWIVALGGAGIASAQSVPNINIPQDVALSPSGDLLATANPESYSSLGGSGFPGSQMGTVSVFSVGAGGRMHETGGSPFASDGVDPVSVAFSPNGGLLAVANSGNDPAVSGGARPGAGVSVFSVSAKGVLKPVAGSPFHTGGQPVSVGWSSTGFLAVADLADNKVAVFSVSAGGALTEVASQPLGQQPCGAATNYATPCAMPAMVRFSHDGRFLATANGGDNTVSVFSVGSGGALTPESGSPVMLPTVPESCSYCPGGIYDRPAYPGALSFSSTGLLAVLSSGQRRVYMYSVGSGGVTPGSVNDESVLDQSDALSFSPDGGLLATANGGSNTVSVFSVGPGGALTPVQTAGTAAWPYAVAFSSTGLLATANGYPSGSVSMFSVSAGGALAEVAGSPFALRVPRDAFIWARVPGTPVEVNPGYPGKPVFNLNSDLLAIPNIGSNGVIMVSVAPDGKFTPVPGVPNSTFPVGPVPCGGTGEPACPDPSSAAFSPDGKLLATANSGNRTVSLFSVGDHGALSGEKSFQVMQPSDCETGPQPPIGPQPWTYVGCAVPYSVAFEPDGHYLALASLQTTTTFTPGTSFNPSPDNPCRATVGCFDGPTVVIVSMWSVDDGQLKKVFDKQIDCSSFRTPYNNIAFNSNGTLLAASCGDPNGVFVFHVHTSGDLLTSGASFPFDTGSGTTTVAFNPQGNLLAVPSISDNDVWVLSVDEANGALTDRAVQPTGSGPYGADFGAATGPLGELLATADYNSHTISMFSVGAARRHVAARAAPDYGAPGARPPQGRSADPLLTEVPGSPIFTGYDLEPDSVSFSPNGQFLATGDAYEFEGFSIWAPTGPLEIRKKASPSVATQGGVLRYRITVHNPNGYPVTATVTDDLADILDAGTLHRVTATAPTVTVDEAARLLTWRGTLLPGHTVTISYSVTIKANASGIVTNRVDGPPNASCGPPAPELPCQTETPIVPAPGPGADLSLEKIASTQTSHPGAQVLYTLVVQNHGPLDATGVTVEDPVPPGLFFHTANPSQGSCTLTATDLTCRLGRIVNGGSAMVLLEATVAPDARGTMTNVANVYGRQHDPNPANNTARSTVSVTLWTEAERDSDLIVVKHAPRMVTQGDTFRYTITVTNRGPDRVTGVTLIDAARLPFKALSIHGSQGSCRAGPPIKCTLGAVRHGTHVTITITALATTAGQQVNTATVMGGSWDSATTNNLASASTTIPPAVPPRFTG